VTTSKNTEDYVLGLFRSINSFHAQRRREAQAIVDRLNESIVEYESLVERHDREREQYEWLKTVAPDITPPFEYEALPDLPHIPSRDEIHNLVGYDA
jgi:hypothetical protein